MSAMVVFPVDVEGKRSLLGSEPMSWAQQGCLACPGGSDEENMRVAVIFSWKRHFVLTDGSRVVGSWAPQGLKESTHYYGVESLLGTSALSDVPITLITKQRVHFLHQRVRGGFVGGAQPASHLLARSPFVVPTDWVSK